MEGLLKFQMSGRLIMGVGALAELPAALQRLDISKPLLCDSETALFR